MRIQRSSRLWLHGLGLLALSVHSGQASSQTSSGLKNRMLPTIEGTLGLLNVNADAKDEIGKKGTSKGASLYLNYHESSWVYGFGLGIANQEAEGSSDNRGIKQTVRVIAPVIGLHGLYEITDSFLIGLQSSTLNGKGAAFDPWDTEKTSLITYVGPRLEWYRDFTEYRFTTFGQVLTSLNSKDRQMLDAQIGVSLAMLIDQKPSPAPVAQPEPKPEPTPPPAPEKVAEPVVQAPPPKITLSSKLVSFDLDSINLRPRSKEFLVKFAAILKQYQASWATLAISGHTDTSGRKLRNEYLSKGRAESVRDVFVQNGVDAKRLKSEGFAFRRLLPGLPPTSAEHRRVELDFGELTGPDAQKLVESLNALINEYKEKL